VAEKVLEICPRCSRESFVVHCGSPTCNWKMCRNGACDLVLDVPSGRGHIVDPANAGRRAKWQLGVA